MVFSSRTQASSMYRSRNQSGWLRSEQMLDNYGVKEENWRDATRKQPHFIITETPRYVGRAVAHLAADAEVARWNGQSLSSGQLAKVYAFMTSTARSPMPGATSLKFRTQANQQTPPVTDNLLCLLWLNAAADRQSTDCDPKSDLSNYSSTSSTFDQTAAQIHTADLDHPDQ